LSVPGPNSANDCEEPPGPLAGFRVVALEQSVAAPVASRILADAGADVVKVEPKAGDFARTWDTHAHGESSHFAWLARRKRSIALDLRSDDDRAVFDRLLDSADVLVYNITNAAAERLELTPEVFEQRWPSLVACQITGYGRVGPTSERRAYDMLVQAESGLLDLTGDDRGPARIGVSIGDIGTGLYATVLILTALLERARTGLGRFLDLSMFEAMTEFAGPNLTAWANAGVRYERNRQRHHAIAPYGIFACLDGHIAIATHQDAEWLRLADCLGRPDLAARNEFQTNAGRVTNRVELEGEVERELQRATRSEWQERFDAIELAYGLINNISEVWDHDVEDALGLHATAVLQDGTEVCVPRSPIERIFGRTGQAPLPGLDEHRLQILAEVDQSVTAPDG
jgi:itaconate CoA-transferase